MTPWTSDPLDQWFFGPMTIRANDFWLIESLTFGLPTLRTNVPLDQWLLGPATFGKCKKCRINNHSDQRPVEPMTVRTTEPIVRLMNPHTINLPDHWPFGLLAIRTYGTIFGPMTLRTSDPSDYWPFGSVHGFRTNEPSDQRPFGISNCPRYIVPKYWRYTTHSSSNQAIGCYQNGNNLGLLILRWV